MKQQQQQQQNSTFGDQVGGSNQKVKGPQLTFDKNYLCMKVNVGEIGQDKVVVTNVGSTTVTYVWRKVQRGDYIQSKNSDGIQRFYCHYPRSILKPGESKTFIFSFRSDQKPGIFFEEWELLTEPLLLQPLPLINLNGMAIQDYQYVQDRKQRMNEYAVQERDQICKELFWSEIFNKVTIPETPPPNMRDPAIFKDIFEDKNKHLGLYFTQGIMNQLYELLEDIQNRINNNKYGGEDYVSKWNGKIEYLEDLIKLVPNPYSRDSLQDRYIRLLSQAKKVPTDRAQSYNVFRKMLLDLSEHTIDLEHKGREELQMMENLGFTVPHEGQTEEEVKKIEEDKKAKKADWLKRTKRKPKTEEEENQENEDLKNKVVYGLKNELVAHKIEKAEQEVDLVKIKWLFENHLKMDETQYDEIYRLESILDIDISGKDLILRLDLDVPLSSYTAPPPQSQQQTIDDHQKSQAQTKQRKTIQQQQQEALLQQQHQSQQEEPWRKRDILDHTLIKKASANIRYCIEHLANRTFIMGNLGEKCGKIKPENSMKIIYNVLSQQLIEQQMMFLPDAIIKDFEQRRENEEFPESTTYMLENLNFKPDEFGYVEPEKPPEEPKPSEEELKKEEELKQQQLAAQQKAAPGKQAPAKTGNNAADKKKQEEEAKKKLEEEQMALKKKMEAMNTEKQMTEEERQEQQRLKEEAERRKRELEYFDYKTIHKYKELLGRYGDIYVNDAPMMTLTNSNSIAEIKCKKRVMGVKMTEEIRKICLFFLKKNPEEIKKLWYTPPTRMNYHIYNQTVLLGGVFKNGQELLDKVLLLNSLLDTSKRVHLYGEFGIAALYALGIKVPRVEKNQQQQQQQQPHDDYAQQMKDYELTKEFFINTFKKAIQREIMIYFPVDFLISQKMELEEPASQVESHNNTQISNIQIQQKTQPDKSNQQSKVNNVSLIEDENTKKSQHLNQQQLQKDQQSKNYHWADKIIEKQKHRYINIQRLVAEKWGEFIEEAYRKNAKENNLEVYGENQSRYSYPYSQLHLQEGFYHEQEPFDEIQNDEFILEFGDVTRGQLYNDLEWSFKLLWDGTLSVYKDGNLCSLTNKLFVSKLLDFRARTAADDEPPVTLLHGSDTETVVRHSIMRLKVEQQEAQEALKLKAAENGEEVEEEEDQITMTQDESKEEASTINQDMQMIADFMCFEIPQFTMKIMQGVPNKALYNLDQHSKKTKEQEEEDLFLLDEI